MRKNIHRKELEKQTQIIDNDLTRLQTECSHKLVLSFEDHKVHNIGRIIECFCPVCGKKVYPSQGIEKTTFNNSKIIEKEEKKHKIKSNFKI